jgi:hypothetical protein
MDLSTGALEASVSRFDSCSLDKINGGISVKANTAVCEAADTSSILLSHPWECADVGESGRSVKPVLRLNRFESYHSHKKEISCNENVL